MNVHGFSQKEEKKFLFGFELRVCSASNQNEIADNTCRRTVWLDWPSACNSRHSTWVVN